MIRSWSYLVVLTCLLWSCGGGDSGGTPPLPPTPPVPDPLAATLVFPDNNKECTEGEVISETQSRVPFQWNNAQNTDSYEVNVRNLNTGNTSKFNANTNSLSITVFRGTPYEWFVVSKANGTTVTASSTTWKFYNEGPGVSNYAPFPAEAINPARGANIDSTTSVTLEWNGSDVDNDIVSYEVYFGTDTTPTALLGTTEETTITAETVADTVYFWQIITIDSAGNSSTSEIFEFKVL